MQLGISQAVFSQNDSGVDCDVLCQVFPKEIVPKIHSDPEPIHSFANYTYCFQKALHQNEYVIYRVDRSNRSAETLFQHVDSSAFLGDYICDSIHFSPSDEFHRHNAPALFFSVYSDLDGDVGTGAPDLYVQTDFVILLPNDKNASLKVMRCRQKKKEDNSDFCGKELDPETAFWCRNQVNR